MGGPHIDALRISPKYTSKDWGSLDRTRQGDWPKAADMVNDRLHGRFLDFADHALKSSEFSGFVVLAIDSLLLETVQQFREGYTGESGQSERMIKDCLKGPRFKQEFDGLARERYYKDIRCGLLHQAEARRMWLIRRGQSKMLDRPNGKLYVLDVKLFHAAVSATLGDYLDKLVQPESGNLRENLWAKMDQICSVRAQRGAAYAVTL